MAGSGLFLSILSPMVLFPYPNDVDLIDLVVGISYIESHLSFTKNYIEFLPVALNLSSLGKENLCLEPELLRECLEASRVIDTLRFMSLVGFGEIK